MRKIRTDTAQRMASVKKAKVGKVSHLLYLLMLLASVDAVAVSMPSSSGAATPLLRICLGNPFWRQRCRARHLNVENSCHVSGMRG